MSSPTDTYAPTARPHYAVSAWLDDHNVFVEIPVRDQPPFIAKYRNDPEGFAQALRAMREYHRAQEAPPKYTPPARPSTTLPPSAYPDTTRAKAHAILTKLGLLHR
jgi:hypothetical protein